MKPFLSRFPVNQELQGVPENPEMMLRGTCRLTQLGGGRAVTGCRLRAPVKQC